MWQHKLTMVRMCKCNVLVDNHSLLITIINSEGPDSTYWPCLSGESSSYPYGISIPLAWYHCPPDTISGVLCW